ncbi:hypothetical protein ACH4U5_09060 [Streptomyces sp. NPDC020858]|uniref:hypothetical protein n=1 Tax=Streptomyces sp. NPDC020858 TaxID=3365097 RepID=UPI0037944D1D
MHLDLCETAHRVDLPKAVRRLPSRAALRTATADHMGLCKDPEVRCDAVPRVHRGAEGRPARPSTTSSRRSAAAG